MSLFNKIGNMKSILYSIGFNSNFYFHYSGLRYGAEDGLLKPFLHTWSLSVEEWFYIILPLLIFINQYSKHKVLKLNVLSICIVIILVLNLLRLFYNSENINWGEDVRRSVLLRIDSLCFGVVAFIIKDKISKKFLFIIFILFLFPILYLILNPKILIDFIFVQNLFLPICAICFSSLLILLRLILIKKFNCNNTD